MNNDLLFVYGSLLDGHNEFGQYLKRNSAFVSNGSFIGRLFDCGEYPGATADINGYTIKGSVYRLKSPALNLEMLDDYEGFGFEQEQPNLFVRNQITVSGIDQEFKCWVYLYNLSVAGSTEITSGDYLAYIKS